jgi:hypothetical protein
VKNVQAFASTVFYPEFTGGNRHGLCWEATCEGILRSRRVKDRFTASRSFFDAVCILSVCSCCFLFVLPMPEKILAEGHLRFVIPI